ncbi:E6-like protein [Hirschfeldia incana]|nr:E6-like protein [Hirschfeldia incana]
MAFSTISRLFFVFLALTLFSTQINARDSYSFGKSQREYPKEQNPNNLQTNETSEQEDQNPPFMPQTENGYGLYGQEATYNSNEDQFKNKKYDENVNYDDSFSTPSLSETQESFKTYGDNYPKTTESYDENNKDSSFYENSNGYGPEKREKEAYKGYYSNNVERQRMSDKSNYENNKDSSYYENYNGYEPEKVEKEAYKGYRNNVERQGMSDTRFMANGKYYYDLDDDRNHGRFYQKHYYNYNPTNYNEDSSFKKPYSSKNMMNEQSEMFGEGQGNQFTP